MRTSRRRRQKPLFTDTSTNNPTSWAWDFDNNGTVDSTVKNPSHVYANPGTYSVKLTATNTGGSDVEIKTGYITVQQPPETIYKSLTPPVRVLDTRPGIGKGLAGAFQANVPATLSIAGTNGIPANAVAITGNLTVVGQTAPATCRSRRARHRTRPHRSSTSRSATRGPTA